MNESVKNDVRDDKDPWQLLPLGVIKWIVRVYKHGAKKYGENRWQNLDNGYQRYKGAMLRHLTAYEEGERFDRDSGLPHLAHMAWNGIAMLYLDMMGRALRPEPYTSPEASAQQDEELEILRESWKKIPIGTTLIKSEEGVLRPIKATSVLEPWKPLSAEEGRRQQ